MNEPSVKKGKCIYCGDAQVNHKFTYIEELISISSDSIFSGLVKHAPSFLFTFVDFIPVVLFKTLIFLRLAKFSDDIEKAASFRSKIIWEEAQRRGIKMRQIIFLNKPLDYYQVFLNGKSIFFESIPLRSESLNIHKNWDDKNILKREFSKYKIPVPKYFRVPMFYKNKLPAIFSLFKTPIIVKPQLGSRGRHTTTNINNLDHFTKAVSIARQICPYVIIEEHLEGSVCRATLVGGVLAGFYRGQAPGITGDGESTIRELIIKKDSSRKERVEKIRVDEELLNHISRFGFGIDDVLPKGSSITLTHHVGRLFGGTTQEMIDELHPSFIPILEKAAKVVGLDVAGFDCIIPDPTKEADSQKWGIIECNTLPFIDLHYFALEGKPRNIAGMVWDLWD